MVRALSLVVRHRQTKDESLVSKVAMTDGLLAKRKKE
jgi:hypothetical protein